MPSRLPPPLRVYAVLVLTVLLAFPVRLAAQGSLSQQVLALLARANSWINTNTFYDLRLPCTTLPSDTAQRLYADPGCSLYFNGTALSAGGGGTTTAHNLLSSTHPDSLPAAPTPGALVVANATPAWSSLPAAAGYLRSTGTATTFSTDGSAFTTLPAASLTGTLPALSGANLTALNASSLTAGTVPLARLSNLTTAQLSPTAGITYPQLALAGGIVNTDISSSAGIAYSKLALTNAVQSTDLTAGAVTMPKIAQSGAVAGQVLTWSGTAWAPASAGSGGTVTSVGLATPSIFTVAGSPVTATGTLSFTTATQAANTFWAAPDGSTGTPTFRSLVAADLPTTGVTAGTYPSVTVNTRGLVTAATSTISLATAVTGLLPTANGGTGTSTAANDTTLVGNGTNWVSTPLPDCTRLWGYVGATNQFTCLTGTSYGTLTVSTPETIAQTWNTGLTTYSAFEVNITDTSSAVTSTLFNGTTNGTSQFAVSKTGTILIGARRVYSTSTPTITSGFGTSPSIAGRDSAFRVTIGSPTGTTGVVTFGLTFAGAPVCTGVDETTTAGNPLRLTATATTVTVNSAGLVAGDILAISCLGY